MNIANDNWTRAHDLALIYIALAYGADQELSEDEIASITRLLSGWRDHFEIDEIGEVVVEAVTVFLEEEGEIEVTRTIHALKETLSAAERVRVLEEAVQIAEADGILVERERNLIAILAEVWELKDVRDDLLKRSTATLQEAPEWSLLHDLCLLYIAVAHSADGVLSDAEIGAMVECLGEWQTDLNQDGIRELVRETLSYYAQQPDEVTLQASIAAVRAHLPVPQRLAVLNDMIYISEADSTMSQQEEELIMSLSTAWDVEVRMGDF